MGSSSTQTGRLLDRSPDSPIGPAAADVSCHRRIDMGIVGMGGRHEQRRRGHDLPRLTIAALDDLQIEPCLLDLAPGDGLADRFDRGYIAIADRADRQNTGSHGFTVEMDCAGTALSDAATEFRTGQTEDIAQCPPQRHVIRGVNLADLAVDLQLRHFDYALPAPEPKRDQSGASLVLRNSID